MKKLLSIAMLLILVAALSLSACAEGGDALARIRERGTLVIATEGNWQPWTYHDENDVLTGFDVEIGTLLAEVQRIKKAYNNKLELATQALEDYEERIVKLKLQRKSKSD